MESTQEGGTHIPEGIPLPSSKGPDKGKRDEWSEDGVLSLLEIYEAKWLLRNRAKLKGSDWEEIARQVSQRCSGVKALKTASQCKNKIESMKKRYRAESAAAHLGSSSSWQYYVRMDALLKGALNSSAQPKCENNINLQVLPEVEANVEVEGQVQCSNHDDGSNTLPVELDVNNNVDNNVDHEKRKDKETDSDVSSPRSGGAIARDGKGREDNPAKRRKVSGSEVADSIRLLAETLLKIEQGRMEIYKDSERIRAETEIKKGEMELKRTEIIAMTQLKIAKLLVKSSCERSDKNEASSLRAEVDILPRTDRTGD